MRIAVWLRLTIAFFLSGWIMVVAVTGTKKSTIVGNPLQDYATKQLAILKQVEILLVRLFHETRICC